MDLMPWQLNTKRLKNLLVETINHYSPSFAEMPVTQIFAQAFRQAGLEPEFQLVPIPGEDSDRANLIVRIGPSPLEFLWVGHVDTVSLWHNEGHFAEWEGDRLYGLGAADMKGACAAIVEAVTMLLESKAQFKRGCGIALVVGEEDYGDGARALLSKFSAPLIVVGEPTSLLPCPAHYGYLECRLTGRGLRAHAALPEIGASAIEAMLNWLVLIMARCRNLFPGDSVAVNPREVHGGGNAFVVADTCEAAIDFHLPPGVDQQPIEAILQETKARILNDLADVELTHAHTFWAPGFMCETDEPRLQPIRRAFETCGQAWRPSVFRSHSDANLFHQAGMLTVVCGPGDLAVAHRREEFVDFAEVQRAAHIYANIIYESCC